LAEILNQAQAPGLQLRRRAALRPVLAADVLARQIPIDRSGFSKAKRRLKSVNFHLISCDSAERAGGPQPWQSTSGLTEGCYRPARLPGYSLQRDTGEKKEAEGRIEVFLYQKLWR
jgi:hypothetical protein